MGEKGQAIIFDFFIAVAILFFLIVGVVSILYFVKISDVKEFDSLVIISKFEQNIDRMPNVDGKNVHFLEDTELNATKLNNFGTLAYHNNSIYLEYFTKNLDVPYNFDVCIFILNSSHGYVDIFDGNFSYGWMANNSQKTQYTNCSELLSVDKTPCEHYEKSTPIIKPVYFEKQYYSMYFVYCYP